MDKDFYKKYFQVEKNYWWFRVRRKIIGDLFFKYGIKKNSKILDFGCGSGSTVDYLNKLGFSVKGYDASAEAINYGLSNGILNLFVTRDGEFDVGEEYDVILLLDVIEHIKDDYSAIGRFREALKPGGTVIITVPAHQWLWGVQDDISHHYRRYSTSSIKRLCDKCGLSIVKLTYFNSFLFLPIAAIRIFSNLLGLKNRRSDFDINIGFLNKFFFHVFDLERAFLRNIDMPFGVSILLVAQKK